MSTYRWMRASDQDPEEPAALLGDAFVAGRLTQDELGRALYGRIRGQDLG